MRSYFHTAIGSTVVVISYRRFVLLKAAMVEQKALIELSLRELYVAIAQEKFTCPIRLRLASTSKVT
jgi:hypothetical protein